jgi:hypothetical protein
MTGMTIDEASLNRRISSFPTLLYSANKGRFMNHTFCSHSEQQIDSQVSMRYEDILKQYVSQLFLL